MKIIATVLLCAGLAVAQQPAPVPEFRDMPGYCRYMEGEIVVSFRAAWLTEAKLILNSSKAEDVAANKETMKTSEGWKGRHDMLMDRWQKIGCALILYSPPKP